MLKPSLFLKLIFIGSTLALNLLLIPLPLQAQDDPVPPGTGGTGDTKPGGTRGTCLGDTTSQSLTALIPAIEQRTEQPLELTTLPHPTVLIYIPKTEAKIVKFIIVEDQSNKPIYKTEINLQKQPGILAIEMPKNQPELKDEVVYRWTVSLDCTDSIDPSVQGWIKRIQPNPELTQALQKTPAEQWLVYAKAGIWYDAIATLATLRQAEPNNPQLESNWQELLQSVKLDAVAKAPLIQP
ncbi:hypothetical protein PCC9214_00195 [Planktothrix tepida]|uniref:DUF928 domain-containing protein n=1 Tax=Planktothrix tepida PCC 9214 TaxID=671072 RepID=A0A1J1LET1_9CYAN|nr:DUF928 domain-containing protein [Planktothrix tepida]CAD5913497.1 hypothetical protein PCC9214_00195 [Planktothrix tepida]CUR30506.1 conserved exported hypothetical protein [Planktothrix tepida PCC 9214]